MSNPSTSDLQERIASLEAELARTRRDLHAARARESQYWRLLAGQTQGAFTVCVGADGDVTDLHVHHALPMESDRLRDIVTNAPGPAHLRKVLQTGRHTSFVAGSKDEEWIVHLAPNVRADDAGKLRGAIQPARTLDDAPLPGGTNGDGHEEGEKPEPRTGVDLDPTSDTPEAPSGRSWSSEPAHSTAPRPPLRVKEPVAMISGTSLQDTERLHRKLVEMLPDAILIVGPDDRIQYANTAAARLTGAAGIEAMIGQRIWHYVHPRSRTDAHVHKRMLDTWASDDFRELELMREDGSSVLVETASARIRYRGQRCALVAVRDLSGRERLAETVSRTLDLFDKAFHLGPAALLILRMRDGLVLEVSERVVEMGGFDGAGDVIGRTLDTLPIDVDESARTSMLRQLLRTRRMRREEFAINDADGTRRVLLAGARLTQIDGDACALISLVNVTQRHRAAKAEEESRTLLQKIFRASPAPIGIVRLDNGRHIDVNDAFCSLVEYPHDEIVGRSYSELNLWVDDDRRRELERQLDEKEAVNDFELRFRTASATVVTALCSFQRIQVNGEACVLAVFTDITNREERRRALVEAKEKAEEVAHFRTAVLSNMTHEVRTPLTVILGFTSMLREGVDEEYHRFVNLIERSGRRLLLTLDSLLDLAQIESGTLELDMKVAAIPQALHSLRAQLETLSRDQDTGLVYEPPKEPLYAEIDEDLFGRVVKHIVDNAYKFTPEGTITLRVDADDEEVYVHIEDTGCGIDEAFLPRIFDAFSQESEGLTRTHQGSGLGLTVSERVMERLGGRIRIDSVKGEGTHVTLCLPRVHATEDDLRDVPFA